MQRHNIAITIVAAALLVASAACGKGDKPSGGEAAKKAPAGPAKATPDKPGKDDPAANKPDDKPKEAVEIVLWHAYRGDEKAAWETVVAAFNKQETGVRIRSQAIPYDPFVDKITITVPRGQGPDLFIFAHNMIGDWVDQDILEPISGRVPPEALKEFAPWSVKALVYRKNLYGLPLAFKSLVLFYNKKFLPEPPATMEDLIAKIKTIQKPEDGLYGLVYEAGKLYTHAIWIHAFGGSVFDDKHQPAFNTEAQKKAINYVRALHREHKVLPAGVSNAMVTTSWNENQAVAVLNGPWFRAEIADGVDYGVAPIPTVDGQTPKPMLGIEAIYISKSSEKKEAALKAALYLAGGESAKVRLEQGKQPVCHAATLEAGAKTDPQLETFKKQANDAVLMDATPEMQVVWASADIAINSVIYGDRTAEAALEKAQKKIVEDIAKRGK